MNAANVVYGLLARHEGHDADDSMAGMSMGSASPSATAAAASASSTAAMGGMGGMGGSGSGAACKISMLWNWNTIDSCFLAKSWHITTKAMFGGTCVGVVFLVVALEFVRRLHREYDRYLIRSWKEKQQLMTASTPINEGVASSPSTSVTQKGGPGALQRTAVLSFLVPSGAPDRYVPTPSTQLIRATIYMGEMAGAYFVMLLAMYYNGYILICIFLGALIGNFFFGADTISCEPGAPGAALEKGMCCC